LARRYASHVTFIWINDWSRLILAMNDALRAGCSLAMQCDRPEYSSKLEPFQFFGAERCFPFTIYHLAIMHERPVILSYAIPDQHDPAETVVFMLPIFHPAPEVGREANFAAARAHFQAFLAAVEAQLRLTPFLWFNFTAMNPPANGTMQRRRRPLLHRPVLADQAVGS
jgi:predicted LPLAT superfamily acyltransferase